jgi:hypothetical protein
MRRLLRRLVVRYFILSCGLSSLGMRGTTHTLPAGILKELFLQVQ